MGYVSFREGNSCESSRGQAFRGMYSCVRGLLPTSELVSMFRISIQLLVERPHPESMKPGNFYMDTQIDGFQKVFTFNYDYLGYLC